jgi:hypothetical protein
MKISLVAILTLTAIIAGCASTRLSDADELAMYRAHAGEPVRDFHYFGSLNGWQPLGDRALAVWTRPNQAYLLQLMGPCNDLDFALAISITNSMGEVSSRFDQVEVHGGSGIHMPCRIEEIRPLDVKGLKKAQSELRKADAVQRKE